MKTFLKQINYYFNRNSKWNLVMFGIICLVLYILLDIYQKNRMDRIKQGHYTIATILEKRRAASRHIYISYTYIVDSIEYNYSESNDDRYKPIVGKKYLVQYSIEDKSESFLYQNIPIPDSIKSAPPNGWKELPEWAKNNKK